MVVPCRILKGDETTRTSVSDQERWSVVIHQIANGKPLEFTPRSSLLLVAKSKTKDASGLYIRQATSHCRNGSIRLHGWNEKTHLFEADFLKESLESTLPSVQKFPWNSKDDNVLLNSETLLEIGLPASVAHPNEYGDLSDRSSQSDQRAIRREGDWSSAPFDTLRSKHHQINFFFCKSIQDTPPECTWLNALQRISSTILRWQQSSHFQVGPKLASSLLRLKSTVLVGWMQGSAA